LFILVTHIIVRILDLIMAWVVFELYEPVDGFTVSPVRSSGNTQRLGAVADSSVNASLTPVAVAVCVRSVAGRTPV
jgi:hypothetical protein